MTVALDETLIAKGISTLLKKSEYERIEDAQTTGTDLFIGAIVTRYGETFPGVDLSGESEGMLGQIIGLNGSKEEIPSQGPWYNDFDVPFAATLWVRIGILKPQGVYLILSETNITIAVGDLLKVVDGVVAIAATIATTPTVPEHYQFTAEEPVAAAADTRKYFYGRFAKT